jgi:protein SCO1/2
MTRLWALAALAAFGAPAAAHDAALHKPADTSKTAETAPAITPLPFRLGGKFTLTDHAGVPRTEADPDGRFQMLFFGYANCQSICSVALPMMAETAELLAERGIDVTPVMITVDPGRDTVAAMGPALARISPDLVGLTGEPAVLDHVYDLYQVEAKVLFEDPQYGPIYAHGSHIYVLDPTGRVATLFPPILSPVRAAGIVAKYAADPAARSVIK